MKLTVEETAQCLDLPAKKVERWINQGRIPIRHDGQVCIFNETTVEKWAAAHHLSFHLPDKKSEGEKPQPHTSHMEGLLSAMKRGGVFYNIKGEDAESVLKASVFKMPCFSEPSKQVMYQKLLEREQLMSTGIGKGVAIPHPRTPLEDIGDNSILATFFLRKAIAFGAIDDKPVFVLFILLSPTTKAHLNLLSRLAFCIRDDGFVSFLKMAPDTETLFSKIGEFEQQLDRP